MLLGRCSPTRISPLRTSLVDSASRLRRFIDTCPPLGPRTALPANRFRQSAERLVILLSHTIRIASNINHDRDFVAEILRTGWPITRTAGSWLASATVRGRSLNRGERTTVDSADASGSLSFGIHKSGMEHTHDAATDILCPHPTLCGP